MTSLQGFIENYIKHLQKRRYSKNTIINYEINLRYFYSFCKTFNIDFRNIKGSDMVKYVDISSNYKASTINLRLSVLKGFYEYLINIDEVTINPIRQSLYIRGNRKKPKPLTEDQEKLFRSFLEVKNEHIRLAFIILLETGIRLSELKKLDINNFIRINKKYYLEIVNSKNNTNRIVPLSVDNYNLISKYAEDNVFYGNIFQMSSRAYQYHADIFRDKFDINFTVHSLRHTYATRKSQEGLPVQIIQKLLGHKNVNTTMYYIEVTDKDILNL